MTDREKMPENREVRPLIRVLGPEDYEGFYALRHEALEKSPHSYGNHLDVWRAASRAQVESMLEQSADDTDSTILGAFDGDSALVGMMGFRRESKINVRHKATLWGFFVSPPARGRGFGLSLLEEILARASRMEGLTHVRLIATENDTAARHLFDKAGFRQYGMEARGICSEGQFFDQIYMMKDL